MKCMNCQRYNPETRKCFAFNLSVSESGLEKDDSCPRFRPTYATLERECYDLRERLLKAERCIEDMRDAAEALLDY